jgi:hypothetical protein
VNESGEVRSALQDKDDEFRALYRVYVAARYLMIGGGWYENRGAALDALEAHVLAAQDVLPYELKG